MENHFEKLTISLDRLQKNIKAIEKEESALLGVKGVHIFWIYALLAHPKGLSEAEIATVSRVNRSLVSRELDKLLEEGIVTKDGKSRYNAKITLTEKGREIASRIEEITMTLQKRVREEISEGELDVFYSVLMRISELFEERNSKG